MNEWMKVNQIQLSTKFWCSPSEKHVSDCSDSDSTVSTVNTKAPWVSASVPTACWDIGFKPLSHESEQEDAGEVNEWVLLASDPHRRRHKGALIPARAAGHEVHSSKQTAAVAAAVQAGEAQKKRHIIQVLIRTLFVGQTVLPDLMLKVNPSSEMWENAPFSRDPAERVE